MNKITHLSLEKPLRISAGYINMQLKTHRTSSWEKVLLIKKVREHHEAYNWLTARDSAGKIKMQQYCSDLKL